MFAREFTLRQSEIVKIKKELNRIRLLFPQISIRFEKTDNESRSKILWVTINGPSEEICEAAKKYMTAMTRQDNDENNARVNVKLPQCLEEQFLHNNCKVLRDIETQNSVVINYNNSTHDVTIQGDELEVAIARSLIDEHIENFQKKRKNEYEIKSFGLKEIALDENIKNFALKLGYNETDIYAAANSCIDNGIELHEDTVLKELTKQCPQKPLETSNISEFYPEEDFVAKTVAEYTVEKMTSDNTDLRGIVIDGSNVAMCHGHKQLFSCIGIEIVVNWFKNRGHKNIKVFVPQWRQESPKSDCPMKNQELLSKLEMEKVLVFTPSRRIRGRRVVCYDDRYIVKYAVETDSIIVSNDQFRDLQKENPKWKQYLDQHILMYSFVNDIFMPPDDPLGRSGPTLNEFLKTGSYQAKVCPYKTKCTYGSKCRYYHPNNYEQVEKTTISNHSSQRCYLNKEKDNVFRSTSRQSIPMSCAAEIKSSEQQQQFHLYDSDIIARGMQTTSDNFSSSEQHQMMRKWQSPQHQPQQVYPTFYPIQQYQYQQQASLHQPNCQSPNQQYYSMPPNNQSSQWSNYSPTPQTFTLQPRNTHHPQNQYYVPSQPSRNNAYQHQSSAYVNMMNGTYYVNQRSMPNNPYFPSPVTSHTLQPLEMSDRTIPYGKPLDQGPPIETSRLYQTLMDMFPGRNTTVQKVLQEHPHERDINHLVSYILNEQNP